MDFLALPRRDLQALCKRNGVRANMTNAAMADALRALPKVDGIEEYVKLPVPVPEPPVQAVVEEKNVGKQGNPLPRGCRAVAKSSEPVEPEEDNEEEKGNAKRQSSKEDAPALGVGRRGATRRARPVPVVPQPAAVAEEEMKRESKTDNAPAPVVGRCGASRRARPSPAMAAQAAESEVAGAEEEQREEVENLKLEATMDDVPALGVGRRGVNQRARAAPSVAALGGKVIAEEEQRAPIPRDRRVKAKGSSAKPIRLDDSDDEEKEDAKPEEQQEDAQIVGVGRRGGASRRAQAAPIVAAPEAKAEEEQRAPVPRGRRVKANSTKRIRLDDSKEEKQDDTKPEEERADAPAIGARRRDASGRAPAPSEAPATRRSAAASKSEAGDVAVEAVPIRSTLQRKPTMKAAAAAEEKAPRRATMRGEVMSTRLQQEVHEEPHEAVGALDMALEAVPIWATRQRKPTMKAAAAAATVEEMAPPRATRRGAAMRTILQPEAQEEPQEAVSAPVCYQQCDALEELGEASDPQKEELNKVDAPKQDEDQDLVIIEDERLMEETPADEPSVTDRECMDKSEMQEQLVDDEKCHAPCGIHEESPILEAVDAPVSHLRCDALEELAEASDPQKEELNEVDAPKQDEDQDVVISEDEMLMEETPAEESSVIDDAQDEPEEAVGALVSYQRCDDLEELAEASDPQKEELNEVNAPKQDEDQDLVIIEDEKLMEEIPAEEASVTDQECTDKSIMQEQLVDDEKCHAPFGNHEESPILGLVSTVTEQASEDNEEAVDAPVSHQRCDAMEELADASDPQKEELNEVDAPRQDEDQDVIIIEGEKLMEETIIEEPSVTHQEWTDNSKMQEQQVDDENCHALLATHKESPILGLVSTVTEQASQDDVGASFQDDGVSCSGLLGKGVCEEAYDAAEEMELVPGVQTLQAPLTGNESDANHESEMGNFNEVLTFREEISEVDTEEVSKKKEHMDIALMLSDIVDEAGFLDCSSNISQVAEEINEKVNTVGVEINEEVNNEDGLGCQEGGDVVVDKVLHDCVDNTILPDCSSDISWVEMEKAGNITSEMPDNRAALDEDGGEQMEVITTDKVLELTGSNVENVGEKTSAEPMAVLEEMGVKVASECEDLTKLSLGQLKAKLKEKLIAKKNKEAKKRVALARVDENVCRSHAKRQQQDLNLQQH